MELYLHSFFSLLNSYRSEELSTFYPRNYRERDPREYLFKYPDRIHPTVLSKSLSNFLHYSLLDLMESTAAYEKQVLVPFSCFTWRRIRALKDINYFSFKVGKESYFMINPLDLKQIERGKLQNYLDNLNWNH